MLLVSLFYSVTWTQIQGASTFLLKYLEEGIPLYLERTSSFVERATFTNMPASVPLVVHCPSVVVFSLEVEKLVIPIVIASGQHEWNFLTIIPLNKFTFNTILDNR